jgi:hypothetical protein
MMHPNVPFDSTQKYIDRSTVCFVLPKSFLIFKNNFKKCVGFPLFVDEKFWNDAPYIMSLYFPILLTKKMTLTVRILVLSNHFEQNTGMRINETKLGYKIL